MATFTFRNSAGEARATLTTTSATSLASEDCTGKDLSHCHLVGVTCTSTNFTGADLTHTKFLRCNLTNAVFTATSKLAMADFSGSTLTGVTVAGIDWSQADLSNVIKTDGWHGAIGSRQETADTSHL